MAGKRHVAAVEVSVSRPGPKRREQDELVRWAGNLLDRVPEADRTRGISAGVGATVGAVLGSVVGGPVGAAIGGAAGSAVGVALGERASKARATSGER